MDYATITSQNQITVPQKVRDSLGLKPGDKLAFYNTEGEVVVTKVKDIEEFKGFIKRKKGLEPDPHAVWLDRADRM